MIDENAAAIAKAVGARFEDDQSRSSRRALASLRPG